MNIEPINIKRVEAIKKKFEIIAQNTQIPYDPKNLQEHLRALSLNQKIALIDEGVTAYEELSSEIWKKSKTKDILEKDDFDDLFQYLMIEHLKTKQPITNEFIEKFIENIENYDTEQIVYLPLENVEMPDREKLKIGSYLIKKMTNNIIQELSHKTNKFFDQNQDYSQHDRALRTNNWIESYIIPLEGKICLEFRYIGGRKKAIKRARKAALDLMDLLRYAIPSIFPAFYPAFFYPKEEREKAQKAQNENKDEYRYRIRSGIGLEGELPRGLNRAYTFTSNNTAMGAQGKFIGMTPFIIDSNNIDIMKKIGVFRLARLLPQEKSNLTSFEDVLLRSIHWFANAQIQLEMEDELLDLVTSLETLLTPQKGFLTEAASYGMAFMIGKNLEEREKLMQRYENIYDKRSGSTHHGRRDVDEVDLIEIRYMAQSVLFFSITKLGRWKKHEDLLKWVKNQKLK